MLNNSLCDYSLAVSAKIIVVVRQEIHGLKELYCIDNGQNSEGKNTEKRTQPIKADGEIVVNMPSFELVFNSACEVVAPNEGADAEGEGRQKEDHEAIVHGLFAVITGGDGVD